MEAERKKWKLRIRQHNMFQDNIVVQVMYDGDIRGSFTIHEDEKDALAYWKSIIPVDTEDDRGSR